MDALSERQFDLLARMSALDPPVRIMGGYAEDAPLAGTSTRPHVDIDWLLPRHEQELRLGQAKKLGFQAFEVRGEPAPHQPFYLHGRDGDLELEIGIVDEDDRGIWVRVGRLAFEIGGKPPPPASGSSCCPIQWHLRVSTRRDRWRCRLPGLATCSIWMPSAG
jgi:hypothetical protein